MKILLLVQDKNNRSIQLLTDALQEKLLQQKQSGILFVWEIKDVEWSEDLSSISNGKESIPINDISLVIKRTWGPIREKGLAICQALEKRGVNILNGSEFIKWSHSKIQQYQSLALHQKTDLFPETVYVDMECMESLIRQTKSHNLAKQLLDQIYPSYKFPMVLKKDKGCRADGVYFIDSFDTLDDLFLKDLESLRKGFLFQAFISSDERPEISNYFRLNIVSGNVQSAVQFQLIWKKTEGCEALKLLEFAEAKQMPVDLKIFPEKGLQDIVSACPYPQDVVGIDVMFDGNQMYLLEYNDGPAISLIVDLGEKYLDSDIPEQSHAAQACYNFAKSIASLCVERAFQCVFRKDQVISHAFQNTKLRSEDVLLNPQEHADLKNQRMAMKTLSNL